MTVLVIVLAVVAVAAIAVAAWLFLQQRRSHALHTRFGPEYDRTVQSVGDRRQAEHELAERERRVEHFQLRELRPADRDQFAQAWRTAQARFVDDPAGATGEADQLIGDVMAARGYPVGNFESRAADLSVDHPTVVNNYRAAHRIAQEAARGNASTEDLRSAFVHYRSLFDELLETSQVATTEVRR